MGPIYNWMMEKFNVLSLSDFQREVNILAVKVYKELEVVCKPQVEPIASRTNKAKTEELRKIWPHALELNH